MPSTVNKTTRKSTKTTKLYKFKVGDRVESNNNTKKKDLLEK